MMILALYLISLLQPAYLHAAAYNYNSNSDLIGELQYHKIMPGDSWESISIHYEIGYNELRNANPHVTNLTKSMHQSLLIPTLFVLPDKTDRQGIVISYEEKRLYYFPKNHSVVFTYPISIGGEGKVATKNTGEILCKKEAPVWHVPKSIQEYYKKTYNIALEEKIQSGENNPLGNYAIYTDIIGLSVHGTNNENLIGREVSSGGIRMFNQNIQELYHMIEPYEKIHIVDTEEK